MSMSKNDEITVIPSALDLGVEVVAFGPIEGIDGEVIAWVVVFDVVVEVDDKPEFVTDEKEGGWCGDCLNDDVVDKGRGEERIGFGPRPENRNNM